jgi:uncharacterized membrane protein YeaQ/YmgE (transglycosylase-associated protein family)
VGTLLGWVITGMIAGWVATVVTGERRGCLTTTLIGMAGSVIGGLLYTIAVGIRIFHVNLLGLIMAAFGSVLVIIVWQSFTKPTD